ncbi:hypothetical protein FSOLCH5_003916 [Fusarium solani]
MAHEFAHDYSQLHDQFLREVFKLEEESYGWLWRDKQGKFVNPKYVEITPELGKAEMWQRAIKNYDLWEENRITTYNRAVVRTLARRRICKWAKQGRATGAQIDNDDLLGPGVIQELVWLEITLRTSWLSTVTHSGSEKQSGRRDFKVSEILLLAILQFYTMNFNGTTKTEPVPKVESGFKRKLALERGLHVKTEGKPSPDEDGDIIFVGPNSLSSAPAPGRCSCGGLCNHDAATTSAPTPVMA